MVCVHLQFQMSLSNFYADGQNLEWLTEIAEVVLPADKISILTIVESADWRIPAQRIRKTSGVYLVNSMLEDMIGNEQHLLLHEDGGGLSKPYSTCTETIHRCCSLMIWSILAHIFHNQLSWHPFITIENRSSPVDQKV